MPRVSGKIPRTGRLKTFEPEFPMVRHCENVGIMLKLQISRHFQRLHTQELLCGTMRPGHETAAGGENYDCDY